MTDWQPPDAVPPSPPPPAVAPEPTPSPYGAPQGAWGQAYGVAPAATLPWYRTTVFLVLGGLGMLVLGAAGGGLATFAALAVADSAGVFDTDVTTYGEGGDLETFALGNGQCATGDLDDATSYAEGSAVSCEARHAVEHYASVEPPALGGEGGRFARGDLEDFADSACYLAFEPYVGVTYDDSVFEYVPVLPTETTWDRGTRTVHCVLIEYGGDTSTGSANGSRR
jgi:hypothetical protein